MTIRGYVAFFIISLVILAICILLPLSLEGKKRIIVKVIVGVVCIVGLWTGMRWYFMETASGQRAMIDEKSDYFGGIERTITVYTADGNIIAQYQGKIDIAENDGGYVKFDFEGKRYIYYNCFVESIADIG